MISIIVVCLNAGEELKHTLQSVFMQENQEYEIILQDGMSADGCVEAALSTCTKEQLDHVQLFREKDEGIYDAMNKALSRASGEYLLFLNTGDYLCDAKTLDLITCEIKNNKADIYYGYLYHRALQSYVYPAPQINDFTCYRNVPCHQTCIYSRALFEKRGYDLKYNVRADYEHFLWCYYQEHASIRYIEVPVASYEGGGYSETREHKKQSAMQHREIVVKYMGKKKANHYRRIMWLTLAPLRTKIAENPLLSGVYNQCKKMVYKK